MQDIEAENHTLNKRIAEIAVHDDENACLHHGLAHKLRDSIVCRQRRHSGLIVPSISTHSKSHSKSKLNTIVESLDSIPEIIDIDDYDLCDFNINLIKTRDELTAFEMKIVLDSDFKEKCIRKVKKLVVESRRHDGTNKFLDLKVDGMLRLQIADGVIERIVNSFFHYSFWSSCDGKTSENNTENHDENGCDASNAKKRKISYGKFINRHDTMKSLISDIFAILTSTSLHETELLEFIRSKLIENYQFSAVSQRNSGLYHLILICNHILTTNRYLIAE